MAIWKSTNSEDWEKSGLEDYLLYDCWEPYPAWCVLAGYHYYAITTRDFKVNINCALNDRLALAYEDFEVFTDASEEISEMEKNLDRLRKFWINAERGSASDSPKFFIDWALSKRIRPAWLDWAIERGLYTPKQEAAQPAQIVIENTLDDTECVELSSIEPEISGRREQQHEVILAVIVALKFNPQQIPDTGKATIKQICLTRPRLFTDDGFDHAWKAGVKAGLFKLENHEKYSNS